jgi:hypothetical protein
VYRKAAEQGNTEAADRLAYAYTEGRGVPQDWAEAARWYRCPTPVKPVLASCRVVHFEDLPGLISQFEDQVSGDAH